MKEKSTSSKKTRYLLITPHDQPNKSYKKSKEKERNSHNSIPKQANPKNMRPNT